MDTAGDYNLSQDLFRRATAQLSITPIIDLFATAGNHKLPRYASLAGRHAGSTETIDAFSISWTGETPYLFPPVQLIPRVLQKLRVDGVKVEVLVCPLWPSQPWWSLMREGLVRMAVLGDSQAVLRRGPSLTVEHKLPPGRFGMAKLRFIKLLMRPIVLACCLLLQCYKGPR
jgi:hypothetical protein